MGELNSRLRTPSAACYHYTNPRDLLYFTIHLRRILFMKLISLNTWGGKIFEPLADFIRQHSEDTDIFCFQEIYDTSSLVKDNGIRTNLLLEIKNILPDFSFFYFPTISGYNDKAQKVDFNLSHGQAIFVKSGIKIISHEDFFIFKDDKNLPLKVDFSNLPTPLQYINFKKDGRDFSIFNFHGTPFPGNKLDTKRRLLEARKVKEIMEDKTGAKILAGDFNLLPQTQSIKIYESNMRNLIKEFNIQRTRSKLSPFYGNPDFQKFADYTFVSKDIKIKSFEVPKLEISDHLPMILEF